MLIVRIIRNKYAMWTKRGIFSLKACAIHTTYTHPSLSENSYFTITQIRKQNYISLGRFKG
jgi:DNA-directed RNA polymerase specialized sigma54-like protein